MASTSQPIGSVAVEIVADLSRLDAGMDQARATAKAGATAIAGDLGKIEAAEKR